MQFWELMKSLPFGILFFFITVRLMGRKEMAQANPLDFAFAVLMGNCAWDMSFSGYKVWQMVVAFFTVAFIVYLLDWLTARSNEMEIAILGEPKLLIRNGEIIERVLIEERLSRKELLSRLRVLGVFDIQTVEIAYLEMSGQISVKTFGSERGYTDENEGEKGNHS